MENIDKAKFKLTNIKTVGELKEFLNGIPDDYEILIDNLEDEEFRDCQIRISDAGPGVMIQEK